MKISVLLHTTDYRGDHSAEVAIAHEVRPGETVEELMGSLIQDQRVDYIELRYVQERKPA